MLARRLTDGLYMEAMLLADEARAYFDDGCRAERDALSPLDRVLFSCESLRVTTRLMHVVAWLLTQRAVETGEIGEEAARRPTSRLGDAVASDDTMIAVLPPTARALVESSVDLHRRVARFDASLIVDEPVASPARNLLDRLEQSF